MTAKNYARLAAIVFSIVALGQFIRALGGWPVMIGALDVPVWASWIACIVALILAGLGFSASRASR